MMNYIHLLQIVTGLFLVSMLFLVLGAIRVRKLNKSIENLMIRNSVMQNDFTALCSVAVNMGKRIETLGDDVNVLSDKHGDGVSPERVLQAMVTRPYSEARDLLDGGEDLEAVVENCGVTYGEAELLAALHEHAKNEPRH